jgi:hypothetical protein
VRRLRLGQLRSLIHIAAVRRAKCTAMDVEAGELVLPLIVIDGANVVESYAQGLNRVGKLSPAEYGQVLASVVRGFTGSGFEAVAVLPMAWQGRKLPLATPDVLWVPARERGDDDLFAISLAYQESGFLLSNDQFRDHAARWEQQFGEQEGASFRAFVQRRVISYAWAGDVVMPHPVIMRTALKDRRAAPARKLLARSISDGHADGAAAAPPPPSAGAAVRAVLPTLGVAEDVGVARKREVRRVCEALLKGESVEGVASVLRENGSVDWGAVTAREPAGSVAASTYHPLPIPISIDGIADRIERACESDFELHATRGKQTGGAARVGRGGYGGYASLRATLSIPPPGWKLWSPHRLALLADGVQRLKRQNDDAGSGMMQL